MTDEPRTPCFVAIGNWDIRKQTGQGGFGIFSYDAGKGALSPVSESFPAVTVGAAVFDPRRNVLYCTDEHTTLPGNYVGGGGQVFAFAVDQESGALSLINHRPSLGTLPSSIAIDLDSRHLVVTHHTDRVPATKIKRDADGYRIELDYDDATTVLFGIDDDGAIGAPVDLYLHEGGGGPLARQTHPQLHSVTRSPLINFYVVCDKGNDEVVPFAIDAESQRLNRLGPGFQSPPGSSPRYVAFHPRLPVLYVNHETRAVLAVLRYDTGGALAALQLADVLPSGQRDGADVKQSDIVVHPSGRFLYTLIRELDAVSTFAIDQASGHVTLLDTMLLGARGPRGCAVSPDGRFLLVASLGSHDVTIWAIGEDGGLTATRARVDQPNPGTVTFL